MIELNNFYIGESIQFMKENISDNFVDLTVTSPPYDDLRKYKGFIFDYKGVLNELYRITKDGGVVVWIVGDKTEKGSETLTSFQHALYAKEIGFNVHDTMIYQKEGGLKPNPKIPRYAPDFEYMFVFSKGTPKTFNEIRVPCSNAGKKIGNTKKQRQVDGDLKPITLTNQDYKDTKRKGNIWIYGSGFNKSTKDKIAFKHPATFPEKLAEDHITSWSNEGDIILDPFCGSGTTCKEAFLHNRKFIGIDMSEEYINDICIPRLKEYGWHNELHIAN